MSESFRPGSHGGKSRGRVSFTYLADELGHIIETHPVDGPLSREPGQDKTLGPWRKPNKPMHIDTPEKKAQWDAYWDKQIGWWEHERKQEFRDRTWQ